MECAIARSRVVGPGTSVKFLKILWQTEGCPIPTEKKNKKQKTEIDPSQYLQCLYNPTSFRSSGVWEAMYYLSTILLKPIYAVAY